MKIKITVFFLLLVTLLFSCKKDDSLNVGNNGTLKVPLLSKVLIDNQSAYEYTYTDSNLFSEIKSKFDYTIHHYNTKGQLITTDFYVNDNILSGDPTVFQTALNSKELVTPANGKKSGTITYEYNNNGQLTKTTYIQPLLSSSEYSDFTCDNNNRISRQTMYWANVATGYIDYTYDTKGNLNSEMLYNIPSSGTAELITVKQYGFDNAPNPYKSASRLMIPGINTNPNNLIKETYTVHKSAAQGPDNVQVTTNSYTYNDMGYPVSKNGNVSYVYK